MLDLYQDLNTARPGDLQILQVWQRALEDCFVYLGQVETTLRDLKGLEKEVMSFFKIEMREQQHVSEVTFSPKVLEMGVTVANKKLSLSTIAEIRQIGDVVSMCYDVKDVTYVSATAITESLFSSIFCFFRFFLFFFCFFLFFSVFFCFFLFSIFSVCFGFSGFLFENCSNFK